MLCANIVIRNLCVFEINLFHIKKSFKRLFFAGSQQGNEESTRVLMFRGAKT